MKYLWRVGYIKHSTTIPRYCYLFKSDGMVAAKQFYESVLQGTYANNMEAFMSHYDRGEEQTAGSNYVGVWLEEIKENEFGPVCP